VKLFAHLEGQQGLKDEELDRIRQKKIEAAIRKKAEEEKHVSKTDDKPRHLTDRDFDDAIGAANVVLVDFYADWCGPCKMMTSTIDILAKEYSGKALVAKVNVDENPVLTQKFCITSVPTFGIFRGQKLIGTIIGAVGKDPLKKALDKAMSL
jgi:thioredoxin 1